ncbi:MAG: putative metal-dependent hydrolase [Gemmatimonadetes bacterium]|nr:putative metal-dependent hydrolase [Gemmatimonadota bacterium]
MTSDLSYPIGRFDRPGPSTAADRAARMDTLAALPANLRGAVRGLSDAQLDTPYRPGGWTVRQLVHHVADSHMNGYTRVKLALTEENPVIKPYAEAEWAKLPDSHLPVELSLSILDAVHARLDAILRSLTPEQWARPFLHPAGGPQTIDIWAALYAWHSRHHTAHVTALRERHGW